MSVNAIIASDGFKEMPLSTQALYFHLVISADEDGYISQNVQRVIGCSDVDLKALIEKHLLIQVEDGVVVVTNSYIYNYLQSIQKNDEKVTYDDDFVPLFPEEKVEVQPKAKRKKKAKTETVNGILDETITDSNLRKAFSDFVEMRRVKKRPLTPRAINMVLKRLFELSSDPVVQLDIVNQSILHNWDTVYAIHDDFKVKKVGANGIAIADVQDHSLDGIF